MDQDETITLQRAETATAGRTPVPKAVTVPARLGPVRLVREIGRGGMGCVWLGRDEVLDRDVAVKFVLNIAARHDSREVRLFLEGARAAATVEHPGLVPIHHADVAGDVPYLVMGYIDGASLSEILKQRGRLNVEQTVAVLHAVCPVLAALHDAEVVHRDIKPSNILIGYDGRLYLTDFGLACDRVPSGRSLQVKALLGTPAYMAPEMFDGVISPRTDIYALGVTIYELLVGEAPFRTESEIEREDEASDLPRGDLLKRGVPEPLIDLIARMTNPTPMYRLKGARHVQQFLEKSLHEGSREQGAMLADLLRRDRLPEPPTAQSTEPASEDRSSSVVVRDLAERKRQSSADDSSPQPLTQRADSAIHIESEDITCLRCGYNLRGLDPRGKCPECGTPIERSLHGNLLIYSAPEYVAKLHYGLDCILLAAFTVIFGSIMLVFSIAVLQMYFPEQEFIIDIVASLAPLVSVIIVILFIYGWWLFSTPDEAIVGADTGDTPRRVLRATAVISAAVIVLNALGEVLLYQYLAYAPVERIAGLIGRGAWLVQFFASLLYIRWLARRLPSPKVEDLARTYLWLLPVVFVLGFCAFLIGPLIAAVLYLHMLDSVRVHLRRIRKQMAHEPPVPASA